MMVMDVEVVAIVVTGVVMEEGVLVKRVVGGVVEEGPGKTDPKSLLR